ncbi:putative transmembrane protein [Gregarina niphandrodes]|uniref:Transmembrane protein n=1 Tax=Gregarina niphandrodes TaxID=110365 RepID=A0A023B6J5_GRENI|nr:putative transmembrane protein [Gregarina niphandrodes]EZG66568.1 putative transmembrane protein [Gregarina niphandrodes]|eukprot:XP_011130601.1 putative transmembrane protein [Gregarina niphandrodes]
MSGHHEPVFVSTPAALVERGMGDESTLKSRLCRSVNGTGVNSKQLQLVPLSFSKQGTERRWRNHISLPWRFRNYCFMSFYLATLVFGWVGFFLDSSDRRLLDSYSEPNWQFHTLYAVALCLCLLTLLLTWLSGDPACGWLDRLNAAEESNGGAALTSKPEGREARGSPAATAEAAAVVGYCTPGPGAASSEGGGALDCATEPETSPRRRLLDSGWLRNRLESWSYVYLALHLVSAVLLLWSAIFSEHTPLAAFGSTEDMSARVEELAAVTVVLKYNMLVTIFLTFPWMVTALFFQARVNMIWPLLMLELAGVVGCYSLLGAKVHRNYDCVIWGVLNALLLLACYIFRYHRELQERLDFLTYMQTQKRMNVLHQEVMRLSPIRGETNIHGESTLEEMLSLLKQTRNLLTVANTKIQCPEALRAMDIVKEVVKTMSIGGDLFKVRFANIGEEGENIIDQYIRGGHKRRSADQNSPDGTEGQGPVGNSGINSDESAKDTKQARQAVMNTKRLRTTNVGFDCYMPPAASNSETSP